MLPLKMHAFYIIKLHLNYDKIDFISEITELIQLPIIHVYGF